MKVYLSGPITGRPNGNKAAFYAAAEMLVLMGYEVVNPHDLVPPGVSYDAAMRADLRAMLDCDAVYQLEGASSSSGAKLENEVATICGIPVLDTVYRLDEYASYLASGGRP